MPRSRRHMRPARWRGEGILLAVSPLALLSAWLGADPEASSLTEPALWRLLGAGFAFALALLGSWGLRRFPRAARTGLLSSVILVIAVMAEELSAHPALSLALLLLGILGAFSLFEGGLGFLFGPDENAERHLQRARSAMLGTMLLGASFEILRLPERPPQHIVLGLSSSLALLQVLIWLLGEGADEPLRWRLRAIAAAVLTLLVLPLGLAIEDLAPLLALSMLFGLVLMPRNEHRGALLGAWWEPFVDHPARVLISTFFGLCALGTALLLIPAASIDESLAEPINAAFTAVSAVCVTGLIVVDTATQLTGLGQAIVLLLIQMGGLGIMTISTVALFALGRRMSLRQERLMTEISDSSAIHLQSSLLTVVKFTAAAELCGALLLTALFWSGGDELGVALWRGVFTSISAFCNAGFALQSESLVPYAQNPLVLHVVAILIIAGGMAPATCIALPGCSDGAVSLFRSRSSPGARSCSC
jgi:trk system potassium uptake protein TrkH